MDGSREQHLVRMQALLERLASARRGLGPQEVAAIRRDTLAELNRRVRALHGIDEPAPDPG